jgi:hypothetical protein
MYVRAVQLYESGRPLPRHRLAVLRPESEGWLIYKESRDEHHKRTMMKARIVDDTGQIDIFPELMDAVMMFAEDGVMTIRGLERDHVTRKLTAMAWWCQILRPGKRGYQGDPMGPTPV